MARIASSTSQKAPSLLSSLWKTQRFRSSVAEVGTRTKYIVLMMNDNITVSIRRAATVEAEGQGADQYFSRLYGHSTPWGIMGQQVSRGSRTPQAPSCPPRASGTQGAPGSGGTDRGAGGRLVDKERTEYPSCLPFLSWFSTRQVW